MWSCGIVEPVLGVSRVEMFPSGLEVWLNVTLLVNVDAVLPRRNRLLTLK